MSPRSQKEIQLRIKQLDDRPTRSGIVPLRVQSARTRSARAAVTVALVVVALAGGGVGGYALSQRFGAGTMVMGDMAGSPKSAATEGEQWYTCGMHPNVLQKTPGDCPICQMKLTPLKQDTAGSDGSSGRSKERKVLYYRAPMNPGFISKEPGKSPMGMDMVPVYADEDQSASAHTIRIDPVTIQNMGIRTAVVKRGPLIKTIRTVGRVDYDEQLVTFVDTKFEGWIEGLDVDETGQHVSKGQKLFGVYSPDLYTAQQEYLSAVQNLPLLEASTFAPAREEAIKLVEAAVTKLNYFDVSDAQIEAIRETGKIEKALAIHSPASGIVTEKMILDGMYVKPGMRLYTIADLSRVWVYVDIYEYQLPWIRVAQDATMTLPYIPGESFAGRVVYVYPYLEEKTRVIKVRLEFENHDMELKPGMYANIRLESQLQRDAVLVPREAYIDSGIRQVAFIDLGNGKFAPRDIKVGVEAEDGMVEVRAGLDAGEIVVTSGQFMLDAESKLKEAVAKMMEAERAKTTKRLPAPSGENGGKSDQPKMSMGNAMTMPVPMPPDTAYACPMEHHPDETDPANQGPYFSAESGECPRCGMKLKPIDEFPWTNKYKPGDAASTEAAASAKEGIPPDAKYACPMEKHLDEADPADQGPYFSDASGKCPRCGMTLKPIDDLDWVRVRRAAGGGDVAYTCPDHQNVFSETEGECPRCGKPLEPFKVMYTCPDPEHASVISTKPGNCPICGQGMAAYRGVWLDEKMAAANVPPSPGLAETAAYRCPVHPLVNSEKPGHCTICGAELEEASGDAGPSTVETTIDHSGDYVCPMHLEVRSAAPGLCSRCGMQLVNEKALKRPTAAPEHVAAQINYIMEHYLELQRLLASDRPKGLTLQALGLVSASEALSEHLGDPGVNLPSEVAEAAKRLHAAALRITGKIEDDRVTFVELSAAVSTLVEYARPDQVRWPKLYLYHCPMSKGDWLQTVKEKANPYYGFKMLKCGELKGIK